MRDAAGENEYVPGGMEIANPVKGEKHDAQCVSHSASRKPGDAMPANRSYQWTGYEDDEPALEQIDQRRQNRRPAASKTINRDAL